MPASLAHIEAATIYQASPQLPTKIIIPYFTEIQHHIVPSIMFLLEASDVLLAGLLTPPLWQPAFKLALSDFHPVFISSHISFPQSNRVGFMTSKIWVRWRYVTSKVVIKKTAASILAILSITFLFSFILESLTLVETRCYVESIFRQSLWRP